MAREKIGTVNGGKSRKTFSVGYDPQTKRVYVDVGGFVGSTWVDVGQKASSPQEAMRKADAWVWNR